MSALAQVSGPIPAAKPICVFCRAACETNLLVKMTATTF
jgi:hypothetical protein